ncbi:MAG: hypothetical protein OEW67_14825 [Cyclobacteriaceae bacterium]|nr:hypothetical protein [Cyclobacteriaceae bacterium]
MEKIRVLFKKLTAYDHFLVFLIILTILKIINVFIIEGKEEGLHFAILGFGLIMISSVLHLVFSKLFDKNKKYLHSLISTFLIILMLSHADPEPLRGVLILLLLYVSKFFITYKKQTIFNPVVFTIGGITLLALFVPFLEVPPLNFNGIDIRFPIFGKNIPLPLLPIILALIFNVDGVKKHPLAISFIASSLLLGFFINAYNTDHFSYVIITSFIGAAIIVEPKTSPIKNKEQIFFGVIMALFITGLTELKAPNPTIIGLFIGNIGYFSFKKLILQTKKTD